MKCTLLLNIDIRDDGSYDLYITDGTTSAIKYSSICIDDVCSKVTETIRIYTESEEGLR